MPEDQREDRAPDQTPTIRDVAEEVGVSVATVSRVLNGSDLVADATTERVEAAIAELRYHPSRTARALAEPGRRVLAVAVPSFITPFHNALLKGIRFGLRGFECDLLLRDLGSEDSSAELVRFLELGSVDGLLAVGTDLSAEAQEALKGWHAPAVVIGAAVEGVESFRWDDEAGGRAATEHLLEKGHRRIGVIRSARTGLSFQEERLGGYRAALEGAGVAYDPGLVVSGETGKHAGFSEEAGYEAMQKLLEAKGAPLTAVFALSDVQAMGAWAALREAGRGVLSKDNPSGVALVGYDDVKTSQFVGLTSVSQNMHAVGERAVGRLIERLRSSGTPGGGYDVQTETVRPQLRVRRSSDGPAADGT